MSPEVVAAVRTETKKRHIPLANGLACVSVESGGEGFAVVDGERLPIMRWEGHYFDRRVKPTLRDRARSLGLASPKVGGIENPKSQADRYNKLLKPAVALDRQPAYASASYGAPQVMGANAQDIGYASPSALFDKMRESIAGQIEVMFKFIDHNGIVDELQRGDFLGFARVYNGPATSGYSAKMAQAAKQFAKEYPETLATLNNGVQTTKPAEAIQASTMLRVGTSGAKVRELQTLLNRAAVKLGFATVKVDGDFGPTTYDAVVAFQKKHGWTGKNVDGKVGPKTWAALDDYRADAAEQPGALGVLQTEEARSGGATAGGGLGLAAGVDQAKDALSPVVGSGGVVDTIYTVLTIIGVALILAGIGWAAYGYIKSRKTIGIEGHTVS